ncbi:MAG: multidrug effflux MFS transporter [Gammaproteobacteria bacterium]|nr:multidrug effflux MFS transporter [Gammaproteobacteria bacterium]
MNTGLATKRRFVIVLGCLTGIGAVTVDMSLPSIPGMVQNFSATIGVGQQIVGVFVIGIALGQLPAGLISDRIGRIPVLLTGVGIFTIAGIATSIATNMEIMLLARFVQGLGASVGVVIARAIVRDIASGRQAARLLSIMIMIFTAAPMLAPIAGGYLVTAFDWRAPFVAITIFGALILFTISKGLQETRRPNREHHIVRQLVHSLTEFFSHRQSVLGILLVVLPAMGFMSMITGSAALIIEIYGFSVEQFGFIFALAGIAILAGSYLNRNLLLRFNGVQLSGLGATLIGVAALQMLLIAWLGNVNFWWVWGNVCLYLFGTSFLLANATAMALDPVPGIAGVAASILGTSQNLAAAISALVSSAMYDGTIRSVVITMGIFGTLTFITFTLRSLILRGQPIHVPAE